MFKAIPNVFGIVDDILIVVIMLMTETMTNTEMSKAVMMERKFKAKQK